MSNHIGYFTNSFNDEMRLIDVNTMPTLFDYTMKTLRRKASQLCLEFQPAVLHFGVGPVSPCGSQNNEWNWWK